MCIDNEYFMKNCLSLAKIAKERGDGPVGSILEEECRALSVD
jgi:tRNA(adenine34) deaminase